MCESNVYRIAYHEAGHAVVATDLGMEVFGMHVMMWSDGIDGQVQTIGLGVDPSVKLTASVAGQVAEKIAGCRQRLNWRKAGTSGLASDGDRVRNKRDVAESVRKAEAVLQERWPAVEVIAQEIIAGVYATGHHKLSGEEILAKIDGNVT